MLSLNKSVYSARHVEKHGDNIFSKAAKDLSTVTPIIFGIILGPTVVVSSIMSQAAFLMIANILLSVGLSLMFFNRVYQGNAKLPEIFLTLSIITALFFLVLYVSPVIMGLDFLSILSYINLFASSINSFFLMRNILLPPFLKVIHDVTAKLGMKIDTHLDKPRDFQVENDEKKGLKSDTIADELLVKNYTHADSKNLRDNNWRKKAIEPYNHSKEVIYNYATRYRSTLFGEINNRDNITDCLNLVNGIMFKGATDSSHNVFLRNKLIRKSIKINRMQEDKDYLEKNYSSWNPKEKEAFIKGHFIHLNSITFKEESSETLTKCYDVNIELQLSKIINILKCYPLHLAIESLDKYLSKHLFSDHIEKIKEAIATKETKELYSQHELDRLGL